MGRRPSQLETVVVVVVVGRGRIPSEKSARTRIVELDPEGIKALRPLVCLLFGIREE